MSSFFREDWRRPRRAASRAGSLAGEVVIDARSDAEAAPWMVCCVLDRAQ